jgi:hypothetical protein
MGTTPTPVTTMNLADFQNLPDVPQPQKAAASQPAQTPTTMNPTDFAKLPSAGATSPTSPAAKPGDYQQSPGGPIQNANTDANFASPTSGDTTASIIQPPQTATPSLMQRPGEDYSEFMARAVEAGKHVTQKQIEEETRNNVKGILPTLVSSALAGPAMLGTEVGLTEAGGVAATGGQAALKAAPHVVKFAVDHPVATAFAYHLAREMGIPLPKILDMLTKVSGE